jgi:opacity protein-like surface antigen
MGSWKALVLACVLATATAAAARAADLPAAPPLEPVPPPIVDYSGWYIRADVGVGNAVLDKTSSSFTVSTPTGFALRESHLDDSAFAGIGAGYKFNNWFRADVTGEYRTSQRFQAIESATGPINGFYDAYNGSIQSSVFLANGYFDLGNWYGFTPYVGAGAGVALHHVSSLTDVGAVDAAGGLGWAPSHSTTDFAFAAMAGVSFDVTQNVKLDVGYRYLNMGTAKSAGINCVGGCGGNGIESQKFRLASNDIRVGLRWMFAPPPAPVVYDQPIVRKY